MMIMVVLLLEPFPLPPSVELDGWLHAVEPVDDATRPTWHAAHLADPAAALKVF